MPQHPRPTESELAILRVLWRRGPSAVGEIHEALHPDGAVGYNTTLKFLQLMLDKGLVTRDDSARRHVYAPAHKAEVTQRHLAQDYLKRAFGGDPALFMMRALEGQKLSESQMDEIQRLLDEARKRRR